MLLHVAPVGLSVHDFSLRASEGLVKLRRYGQGHLWVSHLVFFKVTTCINLRCSFHFTMNYV